MNYIVPIGTVDPAVLERLRAELCGIFAQLFGTLEPMKIPAAAFDPGRKQYESDRLLEHLDLFARTRIAALGPGTAAGKVLGVTDGDIFSPGLDFIFGQAQVCGRYAIISVARLRQEFYGLPADGKLFFERTLKEAVHELGHTAGLTHCANRECVMSFSDTIEDTDRKKVSFGPEHREEFRQAMAEACGRAGTR